MVPSVLWSPLYGHPQSQKRRAGKPLLSICYVLAHTAQPAASFCGFKVMLSSPIQFTAYLDPQVFSAKLSSAALFVELHRVLVSPLQLSEVALNDSSALWHIHYVHQFGVNFDLLRLHSIPAFVILTKTLNYICTSMSPQRIPPTSKSLPVHC